MESRINHDLAQLERDAKKQGAWEAKLAYATYIIKYDQAPSEKKISRALAYLQEIIDNDIQEYNINARNLLESSKKLPSNAVAQLAIDDLKKANEKTTYPTFSRVQSNSPEFLYKKIRYKYDKLHYAREQTLDALSSLLKHKEMTDTLRAKIYFQLIHLNIEQARDKGQRSYLEEAKKYCHLLTKDSTLSHQYKAKEASRIYTEIKEIIDKPVYDFKTHIKNSFNAGKQGNKQLFKYAGIVAGNVLDFSMLGIPKGFGKHFELKEGYVRKGKTLSQEIFKNNGFAPLFKYAGKKLGEHVVGNLIGGPIGTLLGVITYPFEYLYHHHYKTDEKIKNIADKVINLTKGEEIVESRKVKARSNDTFDSQSLKTKVIENPSVKIFDHKSNDHLYGNMKLTSEEVVKQVKVEHESLFLQPKKSAYSNYAYGSLFAGNVKENPENKDETLVPIYQSKNIY